MRKYIIQIQQKLELLICIDTYIFGIIRGGWWKWNSHSVWVGQGLWSCLGIVELLVASVVILLLDETTSIPTWNWHTNNLFDSFNFTSKIEDKVNKPKNKKRQYTKANTVDKFPNTIVACSPDPVVSTTENFHKESTKAKKVLPHSARTI